MKNGGKVDIFTIPRGKISLRKKGRGKNIIYTPLYQGWQKPWFFRKNPTHLGFLGFVFFRVFRFFCFFLFSFGIFSFFLDF